MCPEASMPVHTAHSTCRAGSLEKDHSHGITSPPTVCKLQPAISTVPSGCRDLAHVLAGQPGQLAGARSNMTVQLYCCWPLWYLPAGCPSQAEASRCRGPDHHLAASLLHGMEAPQHKTREQCLATCTCHLQRHYLSYKPESRRSPHSPEGLCLVAVHHGPLACGCRCRCPLSTS
jgi:hypothetical protein